MSITQNGNLVATSENPTGKELAELFGTVLPDHESVNTRYDVTVTSGSGGAVYSFKVCENRVIFESVSWFPKVERKALLDKVRDVVLHAEDAGDAMLELCEMLDVDPTKTKEKATEEKVREMLFEMRSRY